jgi:hypothetical protein
MYNHHINTTLKERSRYLSCINLIQIVIYLWCLSPLTLWSQTVSERSLPAFHYSYLITQSELRQHIQILASDSLEGRGFGTMGSYKAGDYIAAKLKSSNIIPIGDRETYFQPVVLNRWNRGKNIFEVTSHKESANDVLTPGIDFTYSLTEIPSVLKLSGDHYMFAGYGIEDKNYNDYTYIQARGEVLLMLDGEPAIGSMNLISQSSSRSDWSNNLNKKIALAAQKGAKAVFLIVDSTRFNKVNPTVFNKASVYAEQLSNKYPIPVIRINEQALSRMFSKKEFKRFIKLKQGVQKGKVSSNYIIGKFNLDLSLSSTIVRDRNVVGIIKGNDAHLKDEYIVLSAHFDHLGTQNGEIYNGADDNATGTSALIAVAKALNALSSNGYPLKRSVLFLFCTGEESGLLGSKYFVKHPLVPLKDIKTDINIDMIGRSDDLHGENENYVYVIGSDKINPLLDKTLKENNALSVAYNLDYTYNDINHPLKLYYRSDHYSFAEKGIPSVFLFGGFHEDYHMASDDVDFINFKKVEDLSRLIYFTTIGMANHDGKIKTEYNE